MSVHLRLLLAMSLLTIGFSGCLEDDANSDHWRTTYNTPSGLLLTASVQQPIVFDVYYVAGREPQQYSRSVIVDTLTEVNGAGTVREGRYVELPVQDSSESKRWSDQEIDDLKKQLRTTGCVIEQRCIQFLFLNGEVEGNNSPPAFANIGFAFLFPDRLNWFLATVDGKGPPNPAYAERERRIVVHELGHVLGLVNDGIPMTVQRMPTKEQDPCQCHSLQKDSPMYYLADRPNDAVVDQVFGTETAPYHYNDADWKDIRAYQETLRQQAQAG